MTSLKLYVPTPPAAVAFELAGNPQAQPRPGFSGFKRYNPKKKQLLQTRQKIVDLMQPLGRGNSPFFPAACFVSVELVFHVARPRSHVSSKGSLIAKWASKLEDCIPRRKIDVDNLSKFILDAMVGPMYTDDCQVVKLSCLKLNDNEGSCEGRTEVKVIQIGDKNQLALFG